jgi:hypothetical protein
MIKPSHTSNSKRTPVHCPTHKHTNGKSVLLVEIGVNSASTEGIYVWCRKCHETHFLSIVQVEASLREMREGGMIEGKKEGTA